MHTETRTIQTEVVTQWIEEIKAIQNRVAQTSPYITSEKAKFVYTENFVESTYKLSELAQQADIISQKLLEFCTWLELALKTVVDTDSRLADDINGGNGGGGGGSQSVPTTTPEDLAKEKTKEIEKAKAEEEAKKKAEEEAKKKAEEEAKKQAEEEARKKQEEYEAKQRELEEEINRKNQEAQNAEDEFERILKENEENNKQQQAEQDQNRNNWLNEEGNGQKSDQEDQNSDSNNTDANKDSDSLARQALDNTTDKENDKDSSSDSSTKEDNSNESSNESSGGVGSDAETAPLDATSSLETLDELGELDETLKDASEDGETLIGADTKKLEFGSSRLSSGEKPIVTTGTTKGINPWAVAGLGLAATGIIAGTGLLIKNNACYTFSPEDWVVLSNPVKNKIINNFLKAGFTQNEIETFINSTFKIRVKEMDKYINDIKEASDVDAGLEMEISDQYGFSIYDGDGRIIKYAVFVILILDGVNIKDSFNLYNILNSSLDEKSIDFSYNGLNMMDYIEDQYYPNGESDSIDEEEVEDDDDDGVPKPYDGY